LSEADDEFVVEFLALYSNHAIVEPPTIKAVSTTANIIRSATPTFVVANRGEGDFEIPVVELVGCDEGGSFMSGS